MSRYPYTKLVYFKKYPFHTRRLRSDTYRRRLDRQNEWKDLLRTKQCIDSLWPSFIFLYALLLSKAHLDDYTKSAELSRLIANYITLLFKIWRQRRLARYTKYLVGINIYIYIYTPALSFSEGTSGLWHSTGRPLCLVISSQVRKVRIIFVRI